MKYCNRILEVVYAGYIKYGAFPLTRVSYFAAVRITLPKTDYHRQTTHLHVCECVKPSKRIRAMIYSIQIGRSDKTIVIVIHRYASRRDRPIVHSLTLTLTSFFGCKVSLLALCRRKARNSVIDSRALIVEDQGVGNCRLSLGLYFHWTGATCFQVQDRSFPRTFRFRCSATRVYKEIFGT